MIRSHRQRPRRRSRPAAAAVELTLILPVLCFICVATVDFARLFYHWATLADCARNGALYLADDAVADRSGWTSVAQAALADASNLSPAPTVSSASGTDASGNAYVEVTVSYTFTTIFNYPGIPTSMALSRKLRMAVSPAS